MKRLALTLSLALSAFAVQAQTPAPAETAATPVAAEETTVVTPPAETKRLYDNGCVRETGTKLKRRDKRGCTGAPGESYNRAQIDRTGAVDTADAIDKLSTSGTVRRN